MSEPTKGIPMAPAASSLAVLQNTPLGCTGSELAEACGDIASYHAPTADQAARHKYLSQALEEFLYKISYMTKPGPERSTAISRAREAKYWASSAIAMEKE